MIWFNIKTLEDKLRANEVSDKEGLYYLVANTLLYSLGSYISSRNDRLSWWSYAELICVIAITIYGTFKTYDINKEGDDLDYFKRFQALVFVVGLRILLLVILMLIIAAVILYQKPELLTSPPSMFLIVVLTAVLFYYRLCESFKRISLGNTDLDALEHIEERPSI